MTSVDEEKCIIAKFNGFPWHDARLLNLSISKMVQGDDEVKISVSFTRNEEWAEPQVIIFNDATYINVNLDLEGKRVCSDSISSATCNKSSEWLTSLSRNNPYDNFEGYLHFRISLIPPGGSVDILAMGFSA